MFLHRLDCQVRNHMGMTEPQHNNHQRKCFFSQLQHSQHMLLHANLPYLEHQTLMPKHYTTEMPLHLAQNMQIRQTKSKEGFHPINIYIANDDVGYCEKNSVASNVPKI